MGDRRRIKNKWHRVLYLPLALLQWLFYTIMLSGFGIMTITPIGLTYGFGLLILGDFEGSKESFVMGAMPITIPFVWWYDYANKGEIGLYE